MHPALAADARVRKLLQSETRGARRVLEIGCGVAQYRETIGQSYIGIDITLADYRPGIPRTPDVIGNALSLPFASGSFDAAVMHCVFHLLPDQERCVREVTRILNHGGKLIMIEWSRRAWNHLLEVGHAQTWVRDAPGLRAVTALFESTGLLTERFELTSRPSFHPGGRTLVGRLFLEIAIDYWARSRVTIIARKR
jgi:SAM-dependent methyltransferase